MHYIIASERSGTDKVHRERDTDRVRGRERTQARGGGGGGGVGEWVREIQMSERER